MKKNETIVFGGGCFWCTEAIFKMLKGVFEVSPGYAGGQIPHPTYKQVSMGTTGHIETIKIKFDPKEIRFTDLLKIFFYTHDPTSKDRQGNDVGSQYSSVIFYTTQNQKEQTEKIIEEIAGEYKKPIVTEVKPLTTFYEAEDYHRNYFERNKNQPYCQLVISPKLMKLRNKYKPYLKS